MVISEPLFYVSTWNDTDSNMIVNADTYNECYKLCVISTSDSCYVFGCVTSFLMVE